MPSFEIPADIFTHLSVFDSPKGSSNTFKTHKNISLYFKRRHLIIYKYQVLFRNPRDSLQISILAGQLCPLNSKNFLEIYKRATHRAYGYLFCCFTQSCPDEICYLTDILPCEYPSIVYQL